MKFHQVQIGQYFKTTKGQLLRKHNKGGASDETEEYFPFNSQAIVIPINEEDNNRDHELIEQIVIRAQRDYQERFDTKRLTAALICAHRAKPIRLNDLLHTCWMDFYSDVVAGVYRYYDPKTDTMRDGWTAQHSEPR